MRLLLIPLLLGLVLHSLQKFRRTNNTAKGEGSSPGRISNEKKEKEWYDKIITNDPLIPQNAGTLQKATDESAFKAILPFNMKRDGDHGAMDNEAYVAVNDYFWGLNNGVVIELGALDGQLWSASKFLYP